MKKTILALLFLFFLVGCKEKALCENEEFKLIVTSDIHYFFEDYYKECDWFEESLSYADGKMVTYADEILDAFVKKVKEIKPELVLITGDLTFNGEKASHEQLSRILKEIEEANINVAVIPGNHDVDNIFKKGYGKDDYFDVENVNAEEFKKIYKDLGYNLASSQHKKSLSYTIHLNSLYSLICLDTNSHVLTTNQELDIGGLLTDSTYEWLESQLESIVSKGKRPIVAMHHSLFDHNSLLNASYTIRENDKISSLFNKYDVKFVLTGHIHCQSIKENNGIYDIASESLVDAPLQFGEVRLNKDSMNYSTHLLDILVDSSEYFDSVSRNKFNENFKELKNQTKAKAMLELMVKANRYYFAGVIHNHIDELKNMEGYAYLSDDKSDMLSFYNSYLDSMMEDPNDDTSLVIQY